MKRFAALCLTCLFGILLLKGQDLIILRNGDEIKGKVIEIGTDEIRYNKESMPDGPAYVCMKRDVFMIKFENGEKEVFGDAPATETGEKGTLEDEPATLYFIRPRKMAVSRPEIIIGTVKPDEVILKLQNGHWHKVDYYNFGTIDFVLGIYTINPQSLTLEVHPGDVYYFRCEPLSKGLTVMAEMQRIDEATAKMEMSELKEQISDLTGK